MKGPNNTNPTVEAITRITLDALNQTNSRAEIDEEPTGQCNDFVLMNKTIEISELSKLVAEEMQK